MILDQLTISAEKAITLNEIESSALDVIKRAFKKEISADSEEVKMAIKMLGHISKARQILTNRIAIDFDMAKFIASKPDLRKYVKATNPQIQKAISSVGGG